MSDIFLSYARADKKRAREFADKLEEQGWSVWWDEDILHGSTFRKVIQEQLIAAKCVIVLWSRKSVESYWVIDEASEGLDRDILVPVLIDDVEIPLGFRQKQATRLIDWNGELPHSEFEQLIKSVAGKLGHPAAEIKIQKPGKKEKGKSKAKAKAKEKEKEPKPTTRENDKKKLGNSIGLQVIRIQAGEENEMKITLGHDLELRMARIPAGEFLMGKELKSVFNDEFWISVYPITNLMYKAFVDATHRAFKPSHWEEGTIPEGYENHPVVNVTIHDALAFCNWISQNTGIEVRLPNEVEWEKAARGVDGRKYPWGNEQADPINNKFCNNGIIGDTTPVGKYSPYGDSPYGCADMAGNVWEWTSDKYDENKYVIRGGGFKSWEGMTGSCIDRCGYISDGAYDVGFRIVVIPAKK